VRAPRWISVEEHAEWDARGSHRRPHHETDVTGLEAIRNPSAGIIQLSRFSPDGPFTCEGLLVETEVRRRGITVGLVQDQPSRRCEAVCPVVTDVRFRRLQRVPVRCSFIAGGVDGDQVFVEAPASDFHEQLLKYPFGSLVVPFAEVMKADNSFGISDVKGRPVSVGEGLPHLLLIVYRHRIADPSGLSDSATLSMLCSKLNSGVSTPIVTSPCFSYLLAKARIGKRLEPVDACVGRKIDQDDLCAQVVTA
jgi:hypothetical protein